MGARAPLARTHMSIVLAGYMCRHVQTMQNRSAGKYLPKHTHASTCTHLTHCASRFSLSLSSSPFSGVGCGVCLETCLHKNLQTSSSHSGILLLFRGHRVCACNVETAEISLLLPSNLHSRTRHTDANKQINVHKYSLLAVRIFAGLLCQLIRCAFFSPFGWFFVSQRTHLRPCTNPSAGPSSLYRVRVCVCVLLLPLLLVLLPIHSPNSNWIKR